ncbi:MAG: pseudouridine synthase [Eggerthellaceae bacterium]|jgi:23S rRNA pseudouridine2605 synthase
MAQVQNPDARMRLNRFLARAGVSSRRHADQLILSGSVSVNDQVVQELGVTVDPESDRVCVHGIPVRLGTNHKVLALNKPSGVYSTMSDPQGRQCVADYLDPDRYAGYFHIGRLDRDTTGLLLFTNEGSLGNLLMHPSHHVEKTYIAQVEGTPSATQMRRLSQGVDIKVGKRVIRTAPAEASVHTCKELESFNFDLSESCLEPDMKRTSFVKLTIHQGMKHQVKLMLGAVGHRVVKLHRISFGPIELGSLKLGKTQLLTESQYRMLCKSAGISDFPDSIE